MKSPTDEQMRLATKEPSGKGQYKTTVVEVSDWSAKPCSTKPIFCENYDENVWKH